MSKRRKAYRPKPVAADPMRVATAGVALLSTADVANQGRIMRHALTQLMAGHEGAFHWACLADASNVAEQLAAIGIGRGPEGAKAIRDAQRVLSAVYQRHDERGTWAMRADEIEALRLVIDLHQTQLSLCTHGEFERAFRATVERISQAKKGNAPAGAIVIGMVGDRSQLAHAEPAP
jgi:hypothetical protein